MTRKRAYFVSLKRKMAYKIKPGTHVHAIAGNSEVKMSDKKKGLLRQFEEKNVEASTNKI